MTRIENISLRKFQAILQAFNAPSNSEFVANFEAILDKYTHE